MTDRAERHPSEQERAVFVDGIGPPLRQIREDNVPLLADSQQARDIVNLIDAYLAVASENERLRDILYELWRGSTDGEVAPTDERWYFEELLDRKLAESTP